MRIARIDGGTCPSNQFPGRSLQQERSLRNPHMALSPRRHRSDGSYWPGGQVGCGRVQVRERPECGDGRGNAAAEAVLGKRPAPKQLSHQLVLAIGPEVGAYSSTSLVSEEMPAGKGPVSMFAFKVLAGTPRMQRRSMRCVRV
jgi:hypothetical protein